MGQEESFEGEKLDRVGVEAIVDYLLEGLGEGGRLAKAYIRWMGQELNERGEDEWHPGCKFNPEIGGDSLRVLKWLLQEGRVPISFADSEWWKKEGFVGMVTRIGVGEFDNKWMLPRARGWQDSGEEELAAVTGVMALAEAVGEAWYNRGGDADRFGPHDLGLSAESLVESHVRGEMGDFARFYKWYLQGGDKGMVGTT